MQHISKFSPGEKINIWLELCEFTFRFCKSSLLEDELKRKFKNLRKTHCKEDRLILSRLAKVK